MLGEIARQLAEFQRFVDRAGGFEAMERAICRAIEAEHPR